MRNVRRQLGIQNWDLDVPMVVENRSLLQFLHALKCESLKCESLKCESIKLEFRYQDKRKPSTSMLPHVPLEREQVKTISK